jgi:class 3 adenylate cyclase/tetratricopeptide (TPR) repeat protein
LVGRGEELEWLERCLREGASGLPRLSLILGDPGIGKSRLLREFAVGAAARGICVCHGRGYEDLSQPYLLFEDLLGQLEQLPDSIAGPFEDDRRLIHEIRQASSPLGAAIEGADRQGQSLEERRARLFRAVAHGVLHLARAPTLIVLDDLHWADTTSLELLSHIVFTIADDSERGPIALMIVAAYRPTEPASALGRILSRFEREEICQILELEGLDRSGVNELISELGIERPAHQLVDTLWKATEGNPLFVQQLVRELERREAIEERAGYQFTSVPHEELDFPTDIANAITSQIEQLSDACRRTLTLASFIGGSFQLDDLLGLSDLGENQLAEALEEALAERLLHSEGESYDFAHPLIRRVFYGRLRGTRRRRIHLELADTLEKVDEELGIARDTEIARHLLKAGSLADAEKVVEYARRAGDRMRDVFAWVDAAQFYEDAARAATVSKQSSDRERADLHYWAGLALNRARDPGPCIEHYEKAIEAYRSADDLPGLARALMEKVRIQVTIGAVPYGSSIDVEPLEEVLESLPDADQGMRARVMQVLSSVYWAERDSDRAEKMARRSLELGEAIDDPLICARASGELALAQTQMLEIRESVEMNRRSVAFARRAGDPWFEGQRLIRLPMTLCWLGEIQEATPLALEACELTRAVHNWAEHSLAVANQVVLAVTTGDFAAAESHAREVMTMIERGHYPWAGPLALPALAGARAQCGASREARDAIDVLLEPGRVFEDPGTAFEPAVRVYRQLIAVLEEAPLGAEAPTLSVRDGGSARRRSGGVDIFSLARFCSQIELAHLTAQPGLAEQPYEVLLFAAERGVVFSSGWIFLIPRMLGVAAFLAREWHRSEEHFAAAVDVAGAQDARPELARTYLDQARMRLARGAAGDRDLATEGVVAAHSIFEELGMRPFAMQCVELAATLGIEPATAFAPGPPSELAPQEVDILVRVAQGHGPLEIADALLQSPRTVAERTRELMQRLQLPDASSLATYAVERGYLSVRRARAAKQPMPWIEGATPEGSRIICFTDLARSTEILRKLGTTRARALLRAHEEAVRRCVRTHKGEEIQHTGDGFLLSFASAGTAVRCAREIQRAVAEISRSAAAPLQVRIGMNAGEPIAEDGRLFGAAVNAAARICARGRPGEILVSHVVRELAQGDDIAFRTRGRVKLKGFPERFRLFEVRQEGGE